MLAAYDAQDGPVADGQRTARTWLVHSTRVTRGQAGEHQAVQALAEGHPVLLAGLREAGAVSTSVALQLARWTRPIPAEVRDQAEEILVAARAGADLRALAAICAEMRRLLASDLLPQRAGQPVKALVHVHFAELLDLDQDSILQDKWIGEYRARWAAYRAAASVSTGDGAAWLEGDAARAIACDAMLVPVVTGDVDAGAVEELIGLCVRYHRIRTARAPAGGRDGADTTSTSGSAIIPAGLIGRAARQTRETAAITDILAGLEQQILATILQVVSGPGGVASFLRRNLLGKGLNSPSLPLDVGQTDDIPIHLRRLVALRDQTCQYPGGCDQPAVGCEPHHVQHRADGGRTSLANLKDYCWWHHHVVLHQLGWTLQAHPDGTSQVTSPTGKIIRSHSPPPAPGDQSARDARG